jgi:N-acetylmuramic acid 6-phosphate etherase
LSYICIPSATTCNEAWNKILHRPARPLEGWADYKNVAGPNRINGYDFSSSVVEWRTNSYPEVLQHIFDISRGAETIDFSFEQLKHKVSVRGLSLLNEHIFLKMLLNIHSTLVMGRLDRYQGNVMTCVRPSNFKLIDRSIRYVQYLLQQDRIVLSYEDICLQCFVELETAKPNEPVVLKAYEALKSKKLEQLNISSAGNAPRMPPKMMSSINQ